MPPAPILCCGVVGSAYSPIDLRRALDDHPLSISAGMIAPKRGHCSLSGRHGAVARHRRVAQLQKAQRDWVQANDACRRDILRRLKLHRARSRGEFPTPATSRGRQSGWNNNKNVAMLLDLMTAPRGELRLRAARVANACGIWLNASIRQSPSCPPKGRTDRNEKRFRSLGIARARGPECPVEPGEVGDVGEPAVSRAFPASGGSIPTQLDLPFNGRTALLSPLDRLMYERIGWSSCLSSTTRWKCTSQHRTQVGLLRSTDPVRRSPRRQTRRDHQP